MLLQYAKTQDCSQMRMKLFHTNNRITKAL